MFIPRVLGAVLLSTNFVKSVRNTHQTHAEYDWSVYLMAFCLICFIDFEDPIDISCEKFSLLAEANCHAVWINDNK